MFLSDVYKYIGIPLGAFTSPVSSGSAAGRGFLGYSSFPEAQPYMGSFSFPFLCVLSLHCIMLAFDAPLFTKFLGSFN